MRSVEDALSAILGSARLTASEVLQLDRSAGRVPAERRVRAAVDVPSIAELAKGGRGNL